MTDIIARAQIVSAIAKLLLAEVRGIEGTVMAGDYPDATREAATKAKRGANQALVFLNQIAAASAAGAAPDDAPLAQVVTEAAAADMDAQTRVKLLAMGYSPEALATRPNELQ